MSEYVGKHRNRYGYVTDIHAPYYKGKHRHMWSRGVDGVCLRCWARSK